MVALARTTPGEIMHRHLLLGALMAFAVALQTAPASAQSAYDLSQLNPQVQTAVVAARANEARATAAATQGRAAAQLGEAAAQRARNGAPGTAVTTPTWGDPPRTARYETEVNGEVRQGYGMQTMTAGRWTGDRFAGQYADWMKNGYGVLWYGENEANARFNVNRYEGQFAEGYGNGVGITYWINGNRYFGAIRNDVGHGPGVMRTANGERLEGEFADDQLTGFGVRWDAQGRVLQQGIWSDGRLTTPLAR